MQQSLISIIVPVYNTQRYLSKCIKSLLGQTYKNIEILLIDDGSQDNSLKICKKFAKSDARIKVITVLNGDVSKTRNIGIDSACGEYVCFVDADDFLPFDAIKALYDSIVSTDSDLSCGCWNKISVKGCVQNHHPKGLFSTSDKDTLMDIMDYEEIKGPVAKLFKTDIIKSNNINFPESIKVSEDTVFVYKYLQKCKSISIIDENVYHYNRLRMGSATTRYYSEFNYSSFLCVEQFLKNVSPEGNLKNINLQKKMVNQYLLVNKYILFFKSEDKGEAIKKLEETYNLFKCLFDMDTIVENKQIFEEFIKIIPIIEKNDFNGLFDCLLSENEETNKAKHNSIKNVFITILLKFKIFVIFTLELGYK